MEFNKHRGLLHNARVADGWHDTHDEVSKMNGELTKTVVQNPLEYRALAMAAVQFGSRPYDLGLDVEQATAFCHRLMS